MPRTAAGPWLSYKKFHLFKKSSNYRKMVLLLVSTFPKENGKIRFVPPQLREIGCHVQNHATQWHGFQHEIQFQEVVVAWIQLTQKKIGGAHIW